ncbi:Phosphoenolpyruvate synthase/pyruvate phosphate dikinase [Pyrobaculum oguniense TE7]|uniref:pyruvate, water dikinase n=1 Tax=Pyrobaculum oguniense (strain DSM 13380 / JCM 10595 / TE7) TaxID=698757 RepID=H6Q9F2_PYROT|nr:Phosphoenolpyruvate synthase/pyruvate phosphate dikinase [Pyrobaculum oguniense TE7]
MKYLIPIPELRRTDVALAGGKGASLGELIAAGARVPPGYVVTSQAYRAYLEYNNLDKLVARLDRGEGNPFSIVAEIRERILAGDIPPELDEHLRRVEEEFLDDYLAVRSSATYEDSPDFSFAGIHDTYLGVRGSDVRAYVKRVWASNFVERAVSYKLDNKIPPSKVLMAVVIQKLIDPVSAGVAFSLNPTTGDKSVVAIESSWGLGEAVVSGEVTPDRFYVSKVTGEIIKRVISDQKTKKYALRDGAVVEEELPPDETSRPSLTDEQALRIADVVMRLERYYGHPVDVEWAYGDDVYVLQSRPETVWSKKAVHKWESSGDIIKDIVRTLMSIKSK